MEHYYFFGAEVLTDCIGGGSCETQETGKEDEKAVLE